MASKTRSFASRAAFKTCSMCGTQLFASATALIRFQILPPSEMKSLYGSTTSSAVSCLSYVTFAMVSLHHRMRVAPCRLRFAERFERRPHLRSEELGLFPGGEVAAFGHLVVVDQLRIRPLRPTARRLIKLIREGAHGDRNLDAPGVEETAGRMVRVVPVKARRGNRGVGQPVERDVVEDVVHRQPLRLSVEDARDHFLAARVVVAHPGREADGRVDNA